MCYQEAQKEGHRHLCSTEWTAFRQSASTDRELHSQNMAIQVFGIALKLHAMAKQHGFSNTLELPVLKMLRSRQDANDPSEHLHLMNCNSDIGTMSIYLDMFTKRFPSLFEDISAAEIYSIFNITMCNTVGTSGKTGMDNTLNVSLYLLMSYMNNDCANEAAHYDSIYTMGKRQLSIMADRDIKASEEITCRYNSNENDHDRKIVLRDTYRFFCECARCKNIKIGGFGDKWE